MGDIIRVMGGITMIMAKAISKAKREEEDIMIRKEVAIIIIKMAEENSMTEEKISNLINQGITIIIIILMKIIPINMRIIEIKEKKLNSMRATVA